jgi:phosphoribosylformimino-5-aminoimidazole carboxamide ribotide isomerase
LVSVGELAGLTAAAAHAHAPVIASGGIASLEDIAALAAVPGIGGVITGKALYEGRFTVAEALGVLGR